MPGLATAVRNDTPASSPAAGESGPVVDARRQALTTPFALTHDVQSVPEAVRRLRCGGIDGSRTWRFDLFLNRRSTGVTKDARCYSVAIVELRSSLDMQLSITRRGPLRKGSPLDAPELEVGSEALRRRFVVRGDSAALAADVLDEQLCAWLTGPGRGFHFEITEDRVLAYGRRRKFGRAALCAALGFATLLRDRQLTSLLGGQTSSSTVTSSPLKHTSPAIFIASARGSS